jgi:glycosyltransferase involved in cell wall biosynthesis
MYNLPCTLRAFKIVQEHYPDATLTLVGGGSQEGALRRLAEQLGLRQVTFAGRVAPDDIWQYYADADIYLQTPEIDNMPSSVLEAYASGCAVVSTDAGGVPTILRDGEHGLLAPCGDHAAVAAAVLRLLDEAGLAQRLTTAALDSCARYQWSSVRAQWVRLYRDLARTRAVPAATPA